MIKKFKTSRYLNEDIYGIGDKITARTTLKSKSSAYSHKEILVEGQKLKKAHGVTNKQFKKYVQEAKKHKDHLSLNLNAALGARLDYCIKETIGCNSILKAKQIVSHGKVAVNGKVVNAGNYRLMAGDSILLKLDSIKSTTNNHVLYGSKWLFDAYTGSSYFVGNAKRDLRVKDNVYSFFGSRNRAR